MPQQPSHKMKPSTKRLLSLVAALVMAFAAVVVYFNLTVPEYSSADAIRADVYSRQQLVSDQKNAIASVQKLIADYQGKSGVREVVALSLPLKLDQSGVLHQIQSMANNNKLSLQSLSISAPVSQNPSGAANTAVIRPVGSMAFQIRVVGAYADFKSFLQNLETNIRIFDIRTISVDPLAKPNQDFYGFDLSVVTYYQNP